MQLRGRTTLSFASCPLSWYPAAYQGARRLFGVLLSVSADLINETLQEDECLEGSAYDDAASDKEFTTQAPEQVPRGRKRDSDGVGSSMQPSSFGPEPQLRIAAVAWECQV